ncbi:MAG: pyridoxamine 5'-phosphate oxidase family protein [Jatrophihabitans sp.]
MNERTQVTRARKKVSTDRSALYELLDSAVLGHFALIHPDGHPVVLPTAIARDGDRVLAHGSTGSRWMRLLADGAATCLAVTALDGFVVARSAFESSMHYRSAVIFGQCSVVTEPASKDAALDIVTEHLLPGRTQEIRHSTRQELDATLVLSLPLDEWSLKVSDGWPDDPPEDVADDAWAGVVPLLLSCGTPQPTPDLADGIAVPPSVQRLGTSW